MTPRQRRFVSEYLVDFNAVQAARRAGYTRWTAQAATMRVLRLPAVEAAIEAALQERIAPIRHDADRVIEEYIHIAFADIRRIAEWGPDWVRLKPRAALDAADTAALREISSARDKSDVRVRLHDKIYALNALARHLGLLGRRRSGAPRDQRHALRGLRGELRDRIARRVRGS